MGLQTNDSHSHKVQTKFYKIPKSGAQPFEKVKIYKETDSVRTT